MLGHGQFGEVLELKHLSYERGAATVSNHAEKPAKECKRSPSAKHTAGLRCILFSSSSHRVAEEKETGHDTDDTESVDVLSDDEEEEQTLSFEERQKQWLAIQITENFLREDGTPRYAVKRLYENVKLDLYDDAIVDLTLEAMFLSRLSSHPNIITLYATVGHPGTSSFMLVLDRLTSNLDQKIQAWRLVWQNCRGKALGLWKRDKSGLDALYMERLLAAFDIARALRHLHHHRILYRDIKVSRYFACCLVQAGLTCSKPDSLMILFSSTFSSRKTLVSMHKETCACSTLD